MPREHLGAPLTLPYRQPEALRVMTRGRVVSTAHFGQKRFLFMGVSSAEELLDRVLLHPTCALYSLDI